MLTFLQGEAVAPRGYPHVRACTPLRARPSSPTCTMHIQYGKNKFCGPFQECGGARPNPPNPPELRACSITRNYFLTPPGLSGQVETVHCHAGPRGLHRGAVLEDGLGERNRHHRHGNQLPGERNCELGLHLGRGGNFDPLAEFPPVRFCPLPRFFVKLIHTS